MQQYHVWRAAHKELMSTDADYRRTVKKFEFSIYASVLLNAIFNLVVTLLERRVMHGATFTVIAVLIQIAVNLGFAFFLLHASFRIQGFINEEVGKLLQGKQP